jgi:hypothetical protein
LYDFHLKIFSSFYIETENPSNRGRKARSQFWTIYDRVKAHHPDLHYRTRLKLASIQCKFPRATGFMELSARDEELLERRTKELAALSQSRTQFHQLLNYIPINTEVPSYIHEVIKGN